MAVVETKLYRKYSQLLQDIYGGKVYKLPISLPVSCPNRDGRIGANGCVFCPPQGPGHEILSDKLSVTQQVSENAEYIGKKYKAQFFIAFLQNYCNTYMAVDKFAAILQEIKELKDNHGIPLVGIAIATRPDCLPDSHLQLLAEMVQCNWRVSLELGLQTANYRTLAAVNRQHGLAEFIDAVVRANRFNIKICAHLILNLPGDELIDVIETAKILSALRVDEVKAHALYIAKDTELARQYLAGEYSPGSMQEYVERAAMMVAYLHPEIAIQRLVGRAPAEQVVWANWSTSWWRIHDAIELFLQDNNLWQGKLLKQAVF